LPALHPIMDVPRMPLGCKQICRIGTSSTALILHTRPNAQPMQVTPLNPVRQRIFSCDPPLCATRCTFVAALVGSRGLLIPSFYSASSCTTVHWKGIHVSSQTAALLCVCFALSPAANSQPRQSFSASRRSRRPCCFHRPAISGGPPHPVASPLASPRILSRHRIFAKFSPSTARGLPSPDSTTRTNRSMSSPDLRRRRSN